MVPSSVLTIAVDVVLLLCIYFSLGETIRFESLEFVTDRFGGLSLSPMGNGSDTIIMGSAHGRPPSSLWSITGDSAEDFHTTSDKEGRIDLPSPRMCSTGVLPAPTTTISWLESNPTTQATMTILPWQEMPQPNIDLILERRHAH
jgi:hypothetical protein